MNNATKFLTVVLALALAAPLVHADNPSGTGPKIAKTGPPAIGGPTPPHHKVKCCSARMQAQPRPQH
jgi:hypothetical protein